MRQKRKALMCLSCRGRYLLPWIILTACLLGLQKFKFESALAKVKCVNKEVGKMVVNYTEPNTTITTTTPALIISRSGSSFFSDMFNRNPRTFYFFEPVDSIYSAIYGTATGWNVPSDITGHRNGSLRLPSKVQIDEVSKFLRNLLTCRINDLPMETLTHRFQYKEFYQESHPYVQCISNQTLKDEAERCLALAPVSFCGSRFGETSQQRHDECYRLLKDPVFLRKHPKRALFAPYIDCRNRIRQLFLKSCGRLLSKTCNERPIHAVKTVRATMESMEPLLSALPNFRVIHLLRDPRGVMLSRKRFDASAKTLYSLDRDVFVMSKEASLFCQKVTRDIHVRMNLEKRFPGRIYTVTYEEVMEQLLPITDSIYAFLNVSSPVTSSWWKRKVGVQYTEVWKKTPNKWRSVLTFRESRKILENCAELFRLVGNKWKR